jgi:Leucine-rich repeat (LRR) protein
LKTVNCYANQLPQLDLTHCPALQQVNVANNQLTRLDLTHCPALQQVSINNNQLSQVDFTHLHHLEFLNLVNNQITDLQISNQVLEQLNYIGYSNNRIVLTEEQINIINRNEIRQNSFIETIVDDKQNVHDAQISRGVIDAFDNLKKYPPIVDVLTAINEDSRIPQEVKTLVNKYSSIPDKHSVVDVNYEEALALVYPHHTDGSIITFNEEVLSSVEHDEDVCLTGKLTRLANSLNGFIPDVEIRINLMQYINLKAGKIQNNDSILSADKLQAFLDEINEEECKAQGIDLTPWKAQFIIEKKPEMQ